MIKNKIELLSPAGDFYKGKAALDFGADAIYFGAKLFSLRARASNFDYKDIKNMCIYAHKLGKKAYLVTNIICHNHDIKSFTTFLHRVMKYKIDGFICSDPFIINTIKQNYPKAEIHISTQQSVTNSKAALFFQRNGASRIVMARETSFNELKQTVKNVNNKIDIECFVHGAMCIAYSGRCMLSNYFCLRDSNAGGCAQSCR
jgi:putative protease